MKRRTLIRGLVIGTSLGVTEATLEVMAAARSAHGPDSGSVGHRARDPGALGDHRLRVRARLPDRPPQRLLADVLADFTEVQGLLEQRQPIRYRRRLCRVAAQLAALAASSPQPSAPTARPVAGFTQDASPPRRPATASSKERSPYARPSSPLLRDSGLRPRAGRPSTSYPGRHRGPATTRGLSSRPRALARLGRGDEALPLLRQAEDAFGRLTAEDRDDPSFGHTERQFLWHLGNAWTHLGRTEDAWQVQRRALDLYPPTEYLDPTLIRLDRAVCLARDGEPEEARTGPPHRL